MKISTLIWLLVGAGVLLLGLFALVGFIYIAKSSRELEALNERLAKVVDAQPLLDLATDEEMELLARRALQEPYRDAEVERQILRYGALQPVKEYVHRLIHRRDYREARRYLQAGQAIHPFDDWFDLMLAELTSLDAPIAKQALRKIIKESENGASIRRARALFVGKEDELEWGGIEAADDDTARIILLAGDLEDRPFVETTARRLARYFQVDVVHADSPVPWPVDGRGGWSSFIEECRGIVGTTPDAAREAAGQGIAEGASVELRTRLTIARARRVLVDAGDEDRILQFDEAHAALRKSWAQWDAEKRLAVLRDALHSHIGPRTVIVEVTHRGIFEPAMRYILSFGLPSVGIVSYDYMKETSDPRREPSRAQLEQRILLQVANMVGHGLKVERCKDRKCVRIGVAGVSEMDDCHDGVCEECFTKIQAKLKGKK